MKRLVPVLLALTVAGTAAVAAAAQSPAAIRAKILSAAKAQQSVHWVQKGALGSARITYTTDSARTEGIQLATLKVGNITGHLTVEVIDKADYVEGDAAGLELELGLTRAEAHRYAHNWISIPARDKEYRPTAAAVTLPSLVHLMIPRTHLTAFSGTAHGMRVIGVRAIAGKGKKKTLAVLDAPASGTPLPLELDTVTPGEESASHMVLSKWNEQVNVTAPASSTPIATVRAS